MTKDDVIAQIPPSLTESALSLVSVRVFCFFLEIFANQSESSMVDHALTSRLNLCSCEKGYAIQAIFSVSASYSLL